MPSKAGMAPIEALVVVPTTSPKRLNEVADRLRRNRLSGSLPEMREQVGGNPSPVRAGVDFEHTSIAGVACELVTPHLLTHERACIVWLHGGGFCLGSPQRTRSVASALAARLRCQVVSVGYRLAPEDPYPAAIDDVVAVHAELARTPGLPIAFCRASAGGGLAIAATLAINAGKLPAPVAIAALSPWLDLTCSSATFDLLAPVDPIVAPMTLRSMASMYTATHDPRTPGISPVFANFREFPPLLVQVGTSEILLADSIAVARAVGACGGSVVLELWVSMFHVWHQLEIDEASAALDRVCSFLDSHLR